MPFSRPLKLTPGEQPGRAGSRGPRAKGKSIAEGNPAPIVTGSSSSRVKPDHTSMTRPTALSVRAKLAVLAVVCIVAVVGTTLSILHSRDAAANRLGKGPASPAVGQRTKAATLDGSYLVFRSTALNRDFGRLEVVPLVDPTATPALTSMKCDRVDFEGGHGVCLNEPTAGLFASTTASVFDSQFHVLHTVPVTGYPSRVRVSPDGEYAATTTFVSGDSYATMGFSTRTSILDLSAGKVLYGLEKLVVRKNGKVFQAADFNFWGVTFAQNSRLFTRPSAPAATPTSSKAMSSPVRQQCCKPTSNAQPCRPTAPGPCSSIASPDQW